MYKEEIKLCPFCAIKPKLTDGDYYIAHKTGCIMSELEWLIGENAITAWNKRVVEQIQPKDTITISREEYEGLKSMVKDLEGELKRMIGE